MKTISIYSSFGPTNDHKREYIANQLKMNGFQTSRNGELLIVIGGDGTFLSAVRKRFKENPVFVGFNTGNLGFLSEFTVDRVDEFINILKRKEYWIQTYPVYEVVMKEPGGERIEYFINDLVVERKSTKILHMSVHSNGQDLCSISGDGLIISGALGSTGYNASAGGSILMDGDNTLQITPICPVRSKAYQSLTHSILTNDKNELTIFPNYKKQRTFRIVCDGKEIETKKVRFVEVRKSKYVVQLLRSKKYNGIQNIKNKIFDEE